MERKNKTHSFKKDSASSLISKRLMLIVESLLSHTLYYSALGEAAAAVAAAAVAATAGLRLQRVSVQRRRIHT